MSEQTYYIPFRKYFPPDGKWVDVNIATHKEDVYAKARAIIDAGFHFETELLRNTGKSSTTIGDTHGDYVYRIRAGEISTVSLDADIEDMIMNADIVLMQAMSLEAQE